MGRKPLQIEAVMTEQVVLQPQTNCNCHISPFVTIKNVVTTSTCKGSRPVLHGRSNRAAKSRPISDGPTYTQG